MGEVASRLFFYFNTVWCFLACKSNAVISAFFFRRDFCLCVFIHAFECECICVYVYVHMHVCMCMYVCGLWYIVCRHVCACVYSCARLHVYVCVCMYMHVHVHVCFVVCMWCLCKLTCKLLPVCKKIFSAVLADSDIYVILPQLSRLYLQASYL